METATRAAVRRPELVTDHDVQPAPEAARHLTVLAIYELSETGRKASLLVGGDGRALQQLKVQVPATRLHLVAVDARGTARLKLRPRFEMDAEQRVIRKDAAPTYDEPPTLETLFHEAARNHQLERVYKAERNLARLKRREAEQARRTEIAEAFLADKAQRALVHPTPSPTRCSLVTGQGRILFDIATDVGVARNVPAEAHRRFRSDLAAKKEKNLRDRSAQLALHEEKRRFIAQWIEEHGTPDQKARQAAGMLPMKEAVAAIADDAFTVLAEYPLYKRDGVERLTAFLSDRGFPAPSSPIELDVTSYAAPSATAPQWQTLQEFQARMPKATVALRLYELRLRGRSELPPLALTTILVTQTIGSVTLRREYEAVPSKDSP